jgi:transcription elongation factor GreA
MIHVSEVTTTEEGGLRMRQSTIDRTMISRAEDGVPLTEAGHQRLTQRLDHLETTVLPELAELLRAAGGDAEASAAFARAVEEIERLSFAIRSSVITTQMPDDPELVEVGDLVTFRCADGTVDSVLIVHPVEAPLDDVRVSYDAPIADAMLGHRVGETIVYTAPTGPVAATITRAVRL